MGFRFLLVVPLLLLSSLPRAWGDEVEEQIRQGAKVYASGQYTDAIQQLQFAIAQIQEKLNAGYLALLPEPLAGWQADPPEAQTTVALVGGGTQVSRHYHRDDGQEVTLELTIDSPLLQSLNLTLANPALLSSDPTAKLYQLDGAFRGILHREEGALVIDLAIGSRVMIKATGQNLKDIKPLEAYLKALDPQKVIAKVDN